MSENAPPSAGEVRALAHQLLAWADQLLLRPVTDGPLSEDDRHDLILGVAEAMREVNTLRKQLFDMPFGNPNWDVMLEVFIRDANGYPVTTDQVASESRLPALTVQRSVELLAARGLMVRTPDRYDTLVEWLSLSPRGKRGMTELLLRTAGFVRPHAEGTRQGGVPEARNAGRAA